MSAEHPGNEDSIGVRQERFNSLARFFQSSGGTLKVSVVDGQEESMPVRLNKLRHAVCHSPFHLLVLLPELILYPFIYSRFNGVSFAIILQ